MKLPVPLVFDWDIGNLEKSWGKHNVYHREAEEVFFNKPLKVFKDEKHSADETRFVAYGINNSDRKLTLIFTIREQKIRIISARDQSKKERRVYET